MKSLFECSEMLLEVSRSLEERNKELSDIVLTIASEVLNRANYEKYGNEMGCNSHSNSIESEQPLTENIKNLVNKIRNSINVKYS